MNRLQPVVRRFKRERQIWILAVPLIVWVLIFAYYPMYGLIISVLKYIPGRSILSSEWVGLLYFKQFITSPEFPMVLRNTLAISGLGILLGFPAPIILALLLNEIRRAPFKKFVQTISYLPHFISWVVTASLLFTILGHDGVVNKLLVDIGFIEKPIAFIRGDSSFWWLLTFLNIWKGIGWSSIIYLSAIAGINEEMYQAGAVDGLGRFGMVWHITLPSILPTIIILWILGIGSILNAGFEQQLLIGNPQTRAFHEVVDTYVYKYGIQLGRYSYGTAVGFMKSIIGLTLVFVTNRLAKKKFGLSLF
ncbi:MAG: sugar ABC transporter permease [Bacteroidetes bacterium]|nr:sugar ABC transporter permease [Bacteroidota bacterium]